MVSEMKVQARNLGFLAHEKARTSQMLFFCLFYMLIISITYLSISFLSKTLKRCQNNQAHTPRMTLGALLTPEHHTTTDPELGRQAVETRVPVCMPPSSSRSAIEHSDHPRHHGGSASQDLNKVGNEGQEQIDLLSDASHDED